MGATAAARRLVGSKWLWSCADHTYWGGASPEVLCDSFVVSFRRCSSQAPGEPSRLRDRSWRVACPLRSRHVELLVSCPRWIGQFRLNTRSIRVFVYGFIYSVPSVRGSCVSRSTRGCARGGAGAHERSKWTERPGTGRPAPRRHRADAPAAPPPTATRPLGRIDWISKKSYTHGFANARASLAACSPPRIDRSLEQAHAQATTR